VFISIDRAKHRFLHKHADLLVVCNLDFIAHVECDIEPVDAITFLKGHDETSLQRLFRNTTGDGPSPYHGDQLRAVLAELAQQYPVTDVDAFEADRQAAFIEGINPDGMPLYKYVRGSVRPAKLDELFNPEPVIVTLTAEATANAARRHPAQAAGSAPAAPATVAPRAPSAPRSAPPSPSAPRSGGVKPVIWKIADEMWEADGRPTDRAAVLHLRKKAMERLEKEHGVKRNTSSNELGNWQKARI
jgi:pyruvate/2-oxoglutarate dehydrogenase complex dihydrolipoamide acyltransferase (E2) component